jgi:hypothetical protein
MLTAAAWLIGLAVAAGGGVLAYVDSAKTDAGGYYTASPPRRAARAHLGGRRPRERRRAGGSSQRRRRPRPASAAFWNRPWKPAAATDRERRVAGEGPRWSRSRVTASNPRLAATRANLRVELSRRRSRVRVPSLPFFRMKKLPIGASQVPVEVRARCARGNPPDGQSRATRPPIRECARRMLIHRERASVPSS